MRLTGKAENEFFEWYRNTDFKSRNQPGLALFYNYCDSMQYGVYLDFFDSVGIRIVIDMDFENEVYDKFALYIEYKKHCFCNYGMNFKTRKEARTEGIENANEIYNLI